MYLKPCGTDEICIVSEKRACIFNILFLDSFLPSDLQIPVFFVSINRNIKTFIPREIQVFRQLLLISKHFTEFYSTSFSQSVIFPQFSV